MGMTQTYAPFPLKEEMIAFVAEAVDRGVTFDTAQVYGPFNNEELVVRGSRPDQVVIATTFGFDLDPPRQHRGVSSRPELIRAPWRTRCGGFAWT